MASNGEVITRLYDMFGRGDIPGVLALLDEKIDWQEPDSLPFDNQTSRQGVAQNIFAPVVELVKDFTVGTKEIHDAGDVVFGLGTYSGTGAATGKSLQAPFVHVWRLRGGKVVGFRTYTDTHAWLDVLGKA
jgi:uncharacterized protein